MRIERFYRPFEAMVAKTLADRPKTTALVTIHSFTPVYLRQPRSVEIGVLHDTDTRLADAFLAVATGFDIRRNSPYSPSDGVTHTLRQHALPRNLLNMMLEIRNDLIATPAQCASMADWLAGWLVQALELCAVSDAKGDKA